jgi:AcrR family transcriptional regulator
MSYSERISEKISERKEREKLERRHDILKSAKSVFFKNGFEKSSMDMVAEECGLAKGTLYLYFKSKEELYVSLVEEGIGIMEDMMQLVIISSICTIQKLTGMVKTYFDFTQKHRDYFTIFMMLDIGTLDGKVEKEKLDHIRMLRWQSFERMENVVSEAIKTGYFKSSHTAKEIVMMIWSATFGAVMMTTEKCIHLEMFKEVDAEKFVMRVANGLITSFKEVGVNEDSLLKTAPSRLKKKQTPEPN